MNERSGMADKDSGDGVRGQGDGRGTTEASAMGPKKVLIIKHGFS